MLLHHSRQQCTAAEATFSDDYYLNQATSTAWKQQQQVQATAAAVPAQRCITCRKPTVSRELLAPQLAASSTCSTCLIQQAAVCGPSAALPAALQHGCQLVTLTYSCSCSSRCLGHSSDGREPNSSSSSSSSCKGRLLSGWLGRHGVGCSTPTSLCPKASGLRQPADLNQM